VVLTKQEFSTDTGYFANYAKGAQLVFVPRQSICAR